MEHSEESEECDMDGEALGEGFGDGVGDADSKFEDIDALWEEET